MQKFLTSTAVVSALMLSGAAFAQEAQTSASLLDNVLADAESLSVSLTNVAQNLNDIDGSITVDTSRTTADFVAIITALNGTNRGIGSYSQVNATTFAADVPPSVLSVLAPTTLSLGNLSTTAIGTLQSGNLTGTIDASGLLAKASSTASSATTAAGLLGEQYGAVAETIAFQNVAVNSGVINGSVGLALNDVNATIGSVSTTAIGALGSGSLTATISGQIGEAEGTGAAVINALVGTQPY